MPQVPAVQQVRVAQQVQVAQVLVAQQVLVRQVRVRQVEEQQVQVRERELEVAQPVPLPVVQELKEPLFELVERAVPEEMGLNQIVGHVNQESGSD